MRFWLLVLAGLMVAYPTGSSSLHAQSSDSSDDIASEPGPCPPPWETDDQSSIVSISEVKFTGALQSPPAEQEEIVASITGRRYSGTVDEVKEEAQERLKQEWQNRGYLNVGVTVDARVLTSSWVEQRIALDVNVDEGSQYRLKRITFKNNRAIANLAVLRKLFPIRDGDIFSRQAIVSGLDDLRRAYGSFGYINFTSVPDTRIDEDSKLIQLDVDLDEGKVFTVSSVDFLGVEEDVRQAMLDAFPLKPGQIFNQGRLERFLLDQSDVLKIHPYNNKSVHRRVDERAGTVVLVFDARTCSRR